MKRKFSKFFKIIFLTFLFFFFIPTSQTTPPTNHLTFFFISASASAETSTTPHGTYIDTSNLCGICHPVHDAPGARWQRQRASLKYEENSASITGSWFSLSNPSLSEGSSIESSDTAARATFTFKGVDVRFLTTAGPNRGIAALYLDGAYQGLIDLYQATQEYQVVAYERDPLALEFHTLEIRPTGDKNPASTSNEVEVDLIQVGVPKYYLLREMDEKALCYTCHNGTGSLYDTKSDFGEGVTTAPVSKHPIPDGTLVCTDCHTPHKKVEDETAPYEAIEVVRLLRAIFRSFLGYLISPNNPNWVDISQDETYTVPAQKKLSDPEEFCGACHGKDSVLSGGNLLKYYQGTTHDSTANISPNANSEISCLSCHEWHASDFEMLLLANIAGDTITPENNGNNNSICFSCHPDSITLDLAYYALPNPSGDIHGSGESTSTTSTPGLKSPYYYQMPQIRCVICHNPHGSQNFRWFQKSVNSRDDISVSNASDTAGLTDFCTACHEEAYTHSGSPPAGCLICHFHGANAIDTDTTTTF